MNILLTGGAGYIGSHTAVVLSEAGHEVAILDNLCNSSSAPISGMEKILGRKLYWIDADVRNTLIVERVLHDLKIDAVIHFAGLKSVEESVSNPVLYYANNTQGTISLIEAMQKTGVNSLVFSSSATVYGDPKYLPYDEDHPRLPVNPYGRSKLQVEEILSDLAFSNKSWRISLLRYFNPVGAHKSRLIGENPRGTPTNLMPYLVRVAAGQLPYLNIFGSDYQTRDGTGERDYIHVMDLAKGHLAALNFQQNHPGCHTFNLGSDHPTSVLEVIKSFQKVTGVPVPYKFVQKRPGDLPIYLVGRRK
jgi:UDP-glucose 4-epimerase